MPAIQNVAPRWMPSRTCDGVASADSLQRRRAFQGWRLAAPTIPSESAAELGRLTRPHRNIYIYIVAPLGTAVPMCVHCMCWTGSRRPACAGCQSPAPARCWGCCRWACDRVMHSTSFACKVNRQRFSPAQECTHGLCVSTTKDPDASCDIWRKRNHVASGTRVECFGATSPRSRTMARNPPTFSSQILSQEDYVWAGGFQPYLSDSRKNNNDGKYSRSGGPRGS
jgi:hypothetical protein